LGNLKEGSVDGHPSKKAVENSKEKSQEGSIDGHPRTKLLEIKTKVMAPYSREDREDKERKWRVAFCFFVCFL